MSTNTVRRETILAAGLVTVLSIGALWTYLLWALPPPSPPSPQQLTPHAFIEINGDANFSDMALLEGWDGDGSPENPFIIDGLVINNYHSVDADCISIRHTRVRFTISNCYLINARAAMWGHLAAGIRLFNVSNGMLVDNAFDSNDIGISLESSYFNIVANNIFSNNEIDIDPFFCHPYFIPVVLLMVGLVGIASLGAKWRMARPTRKDREFEASTQIEAPVDT